MIHTWMEELFDMLLFLCLVMGSLIFSFSYWEDSYQVRCAELVLEEFVKNSSEKGGFSLEEYETLLQQVNRIDSEYQIEVSCVETYLEPCYACIPKEQLDNYYLNRNIRKEKVLKEESQTDAEIMLCKMDSENESYYVETGQVVVLRTGESLEDAGFYLEVHSLEDQVAKITPETEAWQDTYDENFCGIQNVIIQYMGKRICFVVITEGGICQSCQAVCTGRNYEDYMVYPYCTECMSKVPLFTGNVYENKLNKTTFEILVKLNKEHFFSLKKGDILVVTLKKDGNYQTMMQEIVKKREEVR